MKARQIIDAKVKKPIPRDARGRALRGVRKEIAMARRDEPFVDRETTHHYGNAVVHKK